MVVRLIIWLIVAIEAVVVAGIIPVPGHGLSVVWLVYVAAPCLLLYELPMALARHDAEARRRITVAGAFIIGALMADLVGQLFDLWNVRIGPITYDDLVHATAMPFALCAIAWAIAMMARKAWRLQHVPWFVPAFVAMGALSLALLHEIVEYAIDRATRSNAGTAIAPGDIYDTSIDLTNGAIGIGLFVAGLVIRHLVSRRARTDRASQPAK
jgi:hypothetical protein